MLKKEIKFTDLEGKEASITAYFNLSKVEALRLAGLYGVDGDLGAGLNAIVESKDYNKMLAVLEDIILTSYGIKTEDNTGFIKSKESRELFSNSIPYAEVFEQLLTDPEQIKAFTEQVVPKSGFGKEAPVHPANK